MMEGFVYSSAMGIQAELAGNSQNATEAREEGMDPAPAPGTWFGMKPALTTWFGMKPALTAWIGMKPALGTWFGMKPDLGT